MMQRFFCLVIGYAFGMFQTSYIMGKTHHIDIRNVGSGNAGSTNILRTLGTRAGLTVLAVDILKCVLAIILVNLLFQKSGRQILPLLDMYAAAGCVLGHNYPFYLNFKGGKGVAASAGMILAIDWRIFLIIMAVFFVIFFTTHYVSVGSLCAYLTALGCIIVFGALGVYGMNLRHTIEMDLVMTLLTVLALFKHRENIKRLFEGKERKTYLWRK